MKTYKLTPLEQLRLEQKELREEIMISEQKFAYQLQHLKNNWGSVLLKSATSSIVNKVSDRTEIMPISTGAHLTRFVKNNWSSFLLSNYKTLGSIGWKIAKPLALTFITKKATAKLFPKRRKRKKK